jgi:DNA-binding NtrC family response regulator
MLRKKKIFIVDDESDLCLTLANVLEGDRFVVDTFDDPILALENLRKDSYDLVILDIKMKKMDGLELYKEIKKIDHKVKVCFLTASKFNNKAFKEVLSDLEKNQFIQKPIQNEELINIINKIIS